MHRVFPNFKDAVETYLRMGFELTPDKRLVSNDLEVFIVKCRDAWETSVEHIKCRQVQSKLLNHVHVDNVSEEFTQKVVNL